MKASVGSTAIDHTRATNLKRLAKPDRRKRIAATRAAMGKAGNISDACTWLQHLFQYGTSFHIYQAAVTATAIETKASRKPIERHLLMVTLSLPPAAALIAAMATAAPNTAPHQAAIPVQPVHGSHRKMIT